VPTDRSAAPPEADLFFLGRTDTGVPAVPQVREPGTVVPAPPPGSGPFGGSAQRKPTGFEKEYGHVL